MLSFKNKGFSNRGGVKPSVSMIAGSTGVVPQTSSILGDLIILVCVASSSSCVGERVWYTPAPLEPAQYEYESFDIMYTYGSVVTRD